MTDEEFILEQRTRLAGLGITTRLTVICSSPPDYVCDCIRSQGDVFAVGRGPSKREALEAALSVLDTLPVVERMTVDMVIRRLDQEPAPEPNPDLWTPADRNRRNR